MPLPPLKLLDDDTFFIDNSRFEHITTCMRASEYSIVRGRVSSTIKTALTFGSAIHLALKLRYRYCLHHPVTEDIQNKQFLLLEKFWETHPTPLGDHRTLGLAQEAIMVYNRNITQEPFHILTHKNKPIVEEPFAVPLGVVSMGSKKIKVIWIGKLDLGVTEVDNEIWVIDHKTSSVGGDYYFAEYPTSNQMKGYTYSLRHILGKAVKGAQVNAIFVRKPTRTGKGIETARAKFAFDDDTLEEWKVNTLYIVSDFLHSYQREFFTMETKQCVHRFGACQFQPICQMSPSTRLQWLESGEFREDTFSPLHEDEIDLEKFMKEPIPQGFKRMTMEQEKVNQAVDLSSIINDLLK
jgi:hypothetical protein